MKIIALVENTVKDSNLKPKHGLSFYIETRKQKILFDLGPDDTCLYNAQKLGIDLTEVDIVILSHGHKDHGGGLPDFLKVNSKAKIYLHRKAFEPHYIKAFFFLNIFIGLNKDLANDRFILTDDTMRINDELFSDVNANFDTNSNRVMLKKTLKGYVQDDFAHEQTLIMTEEDKSVLLTGCSHRGIANILNTARKYQPIIKVVFGGFHLYNPVTKVSESPEVVQQLANEISTQEIVFYTGHCTGKKAFESMHEVMGDKIQYFSAGSELDL